MNFLLRAPWRFALFALALTACGPTRAEDAPTSARASGPRAEAVFAGGCFWCVESDFEHLDGVIEVVSGYTGGRLEHPRYEDVVTETTGHYESVRVIYDPRAVSYETLVDYLLRHVDPLDAGGQFCDRGPSYRTAIFVASDEERAIAERVKARAAAALGAPVATPILPLREFWLAEPRHQDYYRNNPVRYRYYRAACGRDRRVAEVWRGH